MQSILSGLHGAAFLPVTDGSRAVCASGGRISSRVPGKILSSLWPVNFFTMLQAIREVASAATTKSIVSFFMGDYFCNKGVRSWIIICARWRMSWGVSWSMKMAFI